MYCYKRPNQYTISSLPHTLLIPAFSRKVEPIKPRRLRVDTNLLRLHDNILPNNAVKLHITPHIVSERALNLVPPPTHTLPRITTIVVAIRPRSIPRSWRCLPVLEEVFQRGHGDDHDRDAHLSHRPDVDAVPVGADLDRDKAGKVDRDGQEAEGEGEDQAVLLATAQGEDAEEREGECEDWEGRVSRSVSP